MIHNVQTTFPQHWYNVVVTLKCLLGYQGRTIVNELLLGDMSDMGVSEVGMEDFCHEKKMHKINFNFIGTSEITYCIDAS